MFFLTKLPAIPLIFFASFLLDLSTVVVADSISVSVPSTALGHNAVFPNFLGISFELSFLDEYFGNDTNTIPPTVINYLSAIRNRTGNNPVRIRVGGNSMDSSVYDPGFSTPMLQLDPGAASPDDQSATFGPMLWKVMKDISDSTGGVEYLVGLPLRNLSDTTIPNLAGDAEQTLGTRLDAFLLGNEPDLYTAHQERPGIANYTTDIYIDEFRNVSDRLEATSAGNILNLQNIAGPTICCSWDLDTLLEGGYLAAFSNILKYITIQHYPQNNCFSSHPFGIPYYMQHANVVGLTSWQQPGIDVIQSNTSNPRLIMSEFNSASCGGIPGISDTFAVGSLWSIDYALQMASDGFTAAYIHTRERGISYNLFTPPDGPNGAPGPWTTNPPYYALIATAEALQSSDGNGVIVTDLNISGSKTNTQIPVGGYAMYNAKGQAVEQFVLFNYANISNTFVLPASAFSSDTKKTGIVVKYLSAQSEQEQTNIAWGGQSLAGVGNGEFQNTSATWAAPNKELDCTSGCSVEIPPVAMAVVFAGGMNTINNAQTSPSESTTQASGPAQTSPPKSNDDNRVRPFSSIVPMLAALNAGLLVLLF